jgi:hypothetical protein
MPVDRRAGLILILLLAGCNPVARIANNATAIRGEAQALVDHGKAAGDPVVVDGATRILGHADAIQADIPHVEARVPAWLSTLHWWGIALAVVAVAFILWQSGAFTAIRIAIGWLPRKKVSQAELAVDMLDESRPEGDRELIAAMRAQDSEFDAAFRNAAKRRKQKGTT